jgi:hypothetical protein
MDIKIVDKPIEEGLVVKIAENQFGDMVKFVVDVEQEIFAMGGDLHSDEEALLIQNGSKQQNLWGINYYLEGDDKIEFDSMINLRPSVGNRSRSVEDPKIQTKIREIIAKLIR